MWRVAGAAGEPADSVLRLSAGDGFGLILFRDCGAFFGGWAGSTGGAFLGAIDGFSGSCSKLVQGDNATPGWLARTRGFRIRGNERDLVAADGTALARLVPGGEPHPDPNLIRTLQQPPSLDPAAVEKLRTVPQPLPAGAVPATTATLIGTWLPDPSRPAASGRAPYAKFLGDGSWTTYDGCNGGGGRWTVGSAGELLLTMGPTAGTGCNGPVTEIPLNLTKRVAVSGDALMLYAGDGHLLMRLKREG